MIFFFILSSLSILNAANSLSSPVLNTKNQITEQSLNSIQQDIKDLLLMQREMHIVPNYDLILRDYHDGYCDPKERTVDGIWASSASLLETIDKVEDVTALRIWYHMMKRNLDNPDIRWKSSLFKFTVGEFITCFKNNMNNSSIHESVVLSIQQIVTILEIRCTEDRTLRSQQVGDLLSEQCAPDDSVSFQASKLFRLLIQFPQTLVLSKSLIEQGFWGCENVNPDRTTYHFYPQDNLSDIMKEVLSHMVRTQFIQRKEEFRKKREKVKETLFQQTATRNEVTLEAVQDSWKVYCEKVVTFYKAKLSELTAIERGQLDITRKKEIDSLAKNATNEEFGVTFREFLLFSPRLKIEHLAKELLAEISEEFSRQIPQDTKIDSRTNEEVRKNRVCGLLNLINGLSLEGYVGGARLINGNEMTLEEANRISAQDSNYLSAYPIKYQEDAHPFSLYDLAPSS